MNANQPPIFRKSMHGYNKEDVNTYISHMSRMFFEKEKEYQTSISSCSAKIQEDGKIIQNLETELAAASAAAAEVSRLQEQLQNATAQLEALQTAAQQKAAAESLEDPILMIRNMASAYDMQGDAVSNEISIRAGKIMVAAQNAAEAIVQKAQAEAENIIRGANDRKERIFHNITATADTVMTDISAYMKTAVDKCFQEIYGKDIGSKSE